MSKTKLNQEKKLTELKLQLANFDLAVPGTLRSIYSKCGKQNCICQTDQKGRHGPYWLWDRKVGGKLSSKMVTPQMASQIKKWIDNRRRLDELITKILELSQALAVVEVEKDRKPRDKKM
ncbi:DUF6788 family protein [Bdellovibrionota bacterium FG-2]